MIRNNFLRTIIVLFVTAWAVYEIYPPRGRNLIDVFEERGQARDTNFTAVVTKARALDQQFPERTFSNLRDALGDLQLTNYFAYNVASEKDPNRAVLNRLQRESAGKIKLGLDLQGGTSFLVAIDTNKLSNTVDPEALVGQAMEVLRKRVDKFGVAEPIIRAEGNDRIEVQMPGLSDAERQAVRDAITRPAYLEFRIVHPDSDRLLSEGLLAPGHEILSTPPKKGPDGREVRERVLVKVKPERGLTGKYISRAGVYRDPVSNRPQITFRFNSEGARIFGEITREHVNNRLAIVLDGELYSAPNINEPILGGDGVITGDFDLKEAWQLANVLENPLETPVRLMDSEEVDPSLGKDSIKSGIQAALIGTLAVAAFMLVYYLFAGVVANIALMLNIVILLGVLCSVGTTLTLPGIAGVVLTIGMAVDANVLIYERIREELAAGKSLKGAVNAGYDKAFSTIFDSNLTTLIASVLLIYLGTGPVKGFGVTLTIGIGASMFTALVVTRLIFDWALARNLIKSLPMLHVIRSTRVDFLKWAKPAFIASWLVIIVGLGYGVFVRGHQMLGVDFVGGDAITYTFAKRIESDQLRKVIGEAEQDGKKLGEVMIQYRKDPAANTERLSVTAPSGAGKSITGVLHEKFPDAKFTEIQIRQVGAVIGKEITRTAALAVLLALFGILVYVAFRYEFSFAVGAVVAVLHDILMTAGIYCLTGLWGEGRQFNATIVAAFLTIIGFSINDTIVIFDRVREDLKLGARGSLREVMNRALNETLSRTIITSGTVLIATFALYWFGGGVINDFAFTFLVGIITGTYSSIYIACALVLWWNKGQRPKLAGSAIVIESAATVKA